MRLQGGDVDGCPGQVDPIRDRHATVCRGETKPEFGPCIPDEGSQVKDARESSIAELELHLRDRSRPLGGVVDHPIPREEHRVDETVTIEITQGRINIDPWAEQIEVRCGTRGNRRSHRSEIVRSRPSGPGPV